MLCSLLSLTSRALRRPSPDRRLERSVILGPSLHDHARSRRGVGRPRRSFVASRGPAPWLAGGCGGRVHVAFMGCMCVFFGLNVAWFRKLAKMVRAKLGS